MLELLGSQLAPEWTVTVHLLLLLRGVLMAKLLSQPWAPSGVKLSLSIGAHSFPRSVNPTSPGTLLLPLLLHQRILKAQHSGICVCKRMSFCLALSSRPVLKTQIRTWWVVRCLLGFSHSVVDKCLQHQGHCEKGSGGLLVSSHHLGCILCKEGRKALISGFDLYLQQLKPEFKVENSDVHWWGCAEEKCVGTWVYSAWLFLMYFSKCYPDWLMVKGSPEWKCYLILWSLSHHPTTFTCPFCFPS